MSPLLTRRRPLAGVAATVVAAASLALLPATAAQAATAPTLQWGVSQYLNEHLTGQAFTDGASEDASGVVTFTSGAGWRNGATTSMQYDGTARYAFKNPTSGAELYSITVADPEVFVDAAGAGTISADVSWTVSPSTTGTLSDVVVTTFAADGASFSGNVLSGTPRWAGVAPADSYGTGKPADGKSWAVEFVKAVPASLNPFFYASGSTNDAKKSPAAFVAQVAAPTVAVTTASTDATAGVTLKVAGTGFDPATNPGDNGVYVGLAPSGGLPKVDTQAGMSAFAASAWVMPGEFSAGAWAKTLTAAPGKLDKTKSYSIYTWQAHTHSNTSQDTETPVSIDWAKVFPTAAPATPVKTTVATSVAKKPTTATRGKLALDLGAGATGTVKVKLKRGKLSKKVTATLVDGKATVKLPKLARGTWKVTVTYAGDAGHQGATATSTLKVKK